MATYNGSDKRLAHLFENGGGGGGGTTVIANPSGEATDDLEKLQVGETIYDVPIGGSSTLAGLGDVNLSSPTDGQMLKYDATNNEWVNGAVSSGGGELYLNTIYSETEEKVGYWVNGKPVYSKTFMINNYGRNISSNLLADLDIGIIVENYIEIWDANNYRRQELSYNYQQKTLGNIPSSYWISYIHTMYTKNSDTPEVPQRGNVIYLPSIYSEEEQEVGVWTDGKPLYQKTWRVNNVSISMTSWTDLNAYIPNIGFETFVKCECTDENGTYQGPVLGGINASGHVQMLSPRNGSSSIDAIVAITIQYTKTTDTAGSGSWTPSGAPAHHYSTNEQIVGTWIDGKTLYEISVTATITSGTQWIDTGIDSTSSIVRVEGILAENGGNHVSLPSADPREQIGLNITAVGVVASGKWSLLFQTTNSDARGNLTAAIRYIKSS